MLIILRIAFFILIIVLAFFALLKNPDFNMKFSSWVEKKINNLEDELVKLEIKESQQKESLFLAQYSLIREKMKKIVSKGKIPELHIVFKEKENSLYTITGFKTLIIYSYYENDKLIETLEYKTLDELVDSTVFNDVCIKRDWTNISKLKMHIKISKIK